MDLTAPNIVQKLCQTRILVIGDVMLDSTVYGTVHRISPEAPIPVMLHDHQIDQCGGAANTAMTLGALDIPTVLLGVVGDDATGEKLQQILANDPNACSITVDFIADTDRPTTVKKRFRAAGQQIFRLDNEVTYPINNDVQAKLIRRLGQHLSQCHAVIISDYAKGTLPLETLNDVITLCQQSKVPVVVDPVPSKLSGYRGADYLTPNRQELRQMMGEYPPQDPHLTTSIDQFCTQHQLGGLLLTRSEEGMSLFYPQVDHKSVPPKLGKAHHYLPATAREVFDVTGAGDTLCAVFTAAISSSFSPLQSAELASAAAAVVVGKVGSAQCTASELIQQLVPLNHLADQPNLMRHEIHHDMGSLLQQVNSWRASGLTVGFTNGCFDLLHPGHIAVLQHAKNQCDRLIVAINSDLSVKRLKGETRPINNAKDRTTILMNLPQVDAVIEFSDDTPLRLLEAIRPDCLIKGGDYQPEQVVGAELLKTYGGKVFIAPFKSGYATTRTINRMKQAD